MPLSPASQRQYPIIRYPGLASLFPKMYVLLEAYCRLHSVLENYKISLKRKLKKTKKTTGFRMDPWGTPLHNGKITFRLFFFFDTLFSVR